jgi:fructokinase
MGNSVCFGEVLWDLLPSGKQVGGAPMNVAFRLKEMKQEVILLTAIGKDPLGDELWNFLNKNDLSEFVYRSPKLPTGTVTVRLDESGSADYTITEGVAWDEIYTEQFMETPTQLIFGSLALRTEFNRLQLKKLIQQAKEVVFDVNLRTPFFTFNAIDEFIKLSNIVKMNEDEFQWLCQQLNIEVSQTISCFMQLSNVYSEKIWCITLGEKGALLFENDHLYQSPGFPVEVIDTIGAGDAFLAAFLYKRNEKEQPAECLSFACKVGSTIAGQHGATQALSIELLRQ